jgi:WD40 repeat protein
MGNDSIPRVDVTLTDDAPLSADPPPGVDELAPLRPVDHDRYELRGEHGRGGLGVVMRAFDRQLGREVAMKLLQNPSVEAGRRFLREATITSRLQHPSIVAVHDVVRWTDGHPCYTMPLYPGHSLRVAIDEARDLPARLALLPKALAVVEAIAHAHGRGVIHRDLKPSNVLLGSLGEVVVIDWGLAKSLDAADTDGGEPVLASPEVDATGLGQVMGTPAYMAPEQARGERVDRRADVYSLGALIYCVLAGKPPYEANDSRQALHRLLEGGPADLATQVDGLPPDLVTIVRKAMARAPEFRYPDADALARDLGRFLPGNLVEAHAYTPLALVWRWIARHRVISTALVLVIAVVALAFRRVQVERQVAVAAAARERARAAAMILTQAETALLVDPTQSIAYLKTYPLDAGDWVRVRTIARDAVKRGVARHITRLRQGIGQDLLPWDHGRRFLLVDGARTLVQVDPASGEQEVTCLGDELASDLRDETFGEELVTLTHDGELRVWSSDLGRSELVSLRPEANNASLSSDGAWIVLTADGGLAELYDRRTGNVVPLPVPDLPVSGARFVPGTDRVLVEADGTRVYLYDVSEGQVVYAGAPGLWTTYVTPSGRYVVIVRRGNIEWIDALTLESHGFAVTVRTLYQAIAGLPDGRVVVSDWQGRKAWVWDPHAGTSALTPAYVGTLGAAPSGSWVAGFDTASVALMNPGTNEVRQLYGHGRVLGQGVAFLNDPGDPKGEPTTLATFADGLVRVWDLTPDGALALRMGRRLYAAPYAVLGGGKRLLVAAQDGRLILRGLDAGSPEEVLTRLPARPNRIVAAPDGVHALISTLDGKLLRFDLATRKLETLDHDVPSIQDMAITRDGRHAVGVSLHESTGIVWDLEHGRSVRLGEMHGTCEAVALSPDDRSAVLSCSIGRERSYTTYDFATGAVASLPLPSSLVHMLGFSPSGRYLYGIAAPGDLLRWTWATKVLDRRPTHAAGGRAGLVLTDDLVFSSGADGLKLTYFGLGVDRLIDRAPLVRLLTYSAETGFLAYAVLGDGDRINLWNGGSGETWNAPKFGANAPYALTDDGHLVAAGFDGILRVFTPPATLSATPAETRAWLDTLTSVELGEERVAHRTCE